MKAKFVYEILSEVLRGEDEWANREIARNVERYKSEIREKPKQYSNKEYSGEYSESLELFKQFMMVEDLPINIGQKDLESTFHISIWSEDDDYDVLMIANSHRDHELEEQLFKILEPAFIDILEEDKFKNVMEIADSNGDTLYVK